MLRPRLRKLRFDSKGLSCPHCSYERQEAGLSPGRFVRHGYYLRSSDGRWITRFRCLQCRGSFSNASYHPFLGQKKRQVNLELWRLLVSGVSQRRSAILLGINRKTAHRKLFFLGKLARLEHHHFLLQRAGIPRKLQLDEMETFEHTKCKPLSIPLVVEEETRLILGLGVCRMPAKGPLAEISRRKYGFRPNERVSALRKLLKDTRHFVPEPEHIRSDSHPYYPPLIRDLFPKTIHKTVESRRSAVTGQGELKKVRWDPIFSLNHTAAMLRANVCRLIRKTWCTTKRSDLLLDHLYLYVVWHNRQILEKLGPRSTG